MFDFKPSEYQEAYFNFISKGVGNAVVNARAGAAKTTTAIMGLNYIPETKKTLFVAFNKSIANELNNKVSDKKNVKACTFNSLGFSICRENFNPEFDEYKYKKLINSNIEELSGGIYSCLSKSEQKEYLYNINKLLDLSRINLCQNKEEILDVVEKYGIPTEGTEHIVVDSLMRWGKENYGTIDYCDMVWLPYELNLPTKKQKYDWIIVDEAQDSSPVQQELIKKCKKKNTRLVAIGDTSQTINAWCGGDKDAFNNYLKEDNTIQLSLPISYRCPKKIIELAREFVPDIQAAPNAIEGEINYNVNPYSPKSNDMVLCRTTAPLSKLYMDFLKKDKKCYIKGADIGAGLINIVETSREKLLNVSFLNKGVISDLYGKMFKLLNKIIQTNGLRIEEAVGVLEFSNFYDSVKTIETLSDGLTTKEELIGRIRDIFTDDDKDGICLSTVHKAKGLEADNVYILCPSLMPSTLATQNWEIEAERNIQYVSITRAKKSLSYIDEKLFPPQKGCADAEATVSELEIKATYYSMLYGTNPINGEKVDVERNTEKIPKIKQVNKYSTNTKTKKIGANKFKMFCK